MDLFIIGAKGIILRVGIWPIEMQDLLDNVVSKAAVAAQILPPIAGDVSIILRHEAKLVHMPLPNPWASRRPIKDKELTVNRETNDGIAVNSSSLMYWEDWDLMDSNTLPAKMQHKMQRTVHIVD